MPSMRAARFDSASRSLAVKDVPVPQPGPGEVLVRVRACGICLSDVHLIDGSLPALLPEVTPGHEAAGVIEAVGLWASAGWASTRCRSPAWWVRRRSSPSTPTPALVRARWLWARTTRWTRVSGMSASRCCGVPTGRASTWPWTWWAPTPCSPRLQVAWGGPAGCS